MFRRPARQTAPQTSNLIKVRSARAYVEAAALLIQAGDVQAAEDAQNKAIMVLSSMTATRPGWDSIPRDMPATPARTCTAAEYAAWENGASFPPGVFLPAYPDQGCQPDCAGIAPDQAAYPSTAGSLSPLNFGDWQADISGRYYRQYLITGTRYYADGQVTDRYL